MDAHAEYNDVPRLYVESVDPERVESPGTMLASEIKVCRPRAGVCHFRDTRNPGYSSDSIFAVF